MTADCSQSTKNKKIKVEERGRSALINNLEQKTYVCTKFDGCVVREGLAADYVLTLPEVGDLVIELKGRDIAHGVRQVVATAEWLTKKEARAGKLAALIVCREYPSGTTSVQRAQVWFKKSFGKLHVRCGNRTYEFADLLA